MGYALKQGFKNIWRNKKFSFTSIATMAACIFMFSVFFSVLVNFRNMVKEAEASVAITVFFDEGLSQDRIDQIGDIITGEKEAYVFATPDIAEMMEKELIRIRHTSP